MKESVATGIVLGGGVCGLLAVGAIAESLTRNNAATILARAQAAQIYAAVEQQQVATLALQLQVAQGVLLLVLLAIIAGVACGVAYLQWRRNDATFKRWWKCCSESNTRRYKC